MMKCTLNWKDLLKVLYFHEFIIILFGQWIFLIVYKSVLIHLLEKIAWDKAAWSEAAKTDPDFLNLGKLWKKYACIFYFSINFYCRCRYR
jgi:hypothetical protein